MIKYCFTWLDGIGDKTEEQLEEQGISTWNDFLEENNVDGISEKRKVFYDLRLERALNALDNDNLDFFSSLGQDVVWRLYPYFKDRCGFLDIEVNSDGEIIVLTVADRFSSDTLVKGMNLDEGSVRNVLDDYEVLVSFNGCSFDIPKIEDLIGEELNKVHIDLRFFCNFVGLEGSLEEIEEKVGIDRPSELEGSAVEAWKAFIASGDDEWLNVLVEYNEEDAINLFYLIEECMERVND